MSDNKIKKATHVGELHLGDLKISCAVLEDSTRVLVERSMATALGVKGGGQYWKKKKNKNGALLPEYISAKYLAKFIKNDIENRILRPIMYKNTNNREMIGLEASILPEICDIWIQAEKNGALTTVKQKEAAHNAYVMMKGFATVGITALIDEATGYQEIRDRDALQKILEKYLSKELMKWQKRFPDEFYEQMFRLNKWRYNPLSISRPAIIGKYTNDIVYDRLAPGVLQELKKKNPTDEITKRRKHHHHQWLTDDIGHPKLKDHLLQVIILMRASSTYSAFKRLLDKAMPKHGDTRQLDFDEEN